MNQKIERVIVEDVSKKFQIGFKKNQSVLACLTSLVSGIEPRRSIQVLKGVSFKIREGEMVGIIGENGSGKSTLLRAIAGIYNFKGKIITRGKIISLIGLDIGMQSRLTMKDNIYFCCTLFGLSIKEVSQRFNSIVEFSELREFVNTKVYQFSSGMLQRLAFSIAIHCNPEILLLDEVFEVGEEKFREKSTKKIKGLVKRGVTVLLASHNLKLIEDHCDQVILMERGSLVKIGNPREIINIYLKKEFK